MSEKSLRQQANEYADSQYTQGQQGIAPCLAQNGFQNQMGQAQCNSFNPYSVSSLPGAISGADVTAAAEQIGLLICERAQLQRELKGAREECQIWRGLVRDLRASPARAEETVVDDPVKADVDKVLDHILHRRAAEHHDKLKRTMEQAERVPSGHDAAIGRAIG